MAEEVDFSLEIATYPLPFASSKTFMECNCHLGLPPCVWPRIERLESKTAEKLIQNLRGLVQRRWEEILPSQPLYLLGNTNMHNVKAL